MNIFQKAITPDMPRVLEGEQIYVYVPQATSTNAGIASYKNADFKVNDGVVSLRRERRDAYNIPDLVLLDERHFPREIVEKDGNEYYKYTTNAILHIVQNLSDQQKQQARENIDAGSKSDMSKINTDLLELKNTLSKQVLSVNGKQGHVILKNSDIENDMNYVTADFVNSSIATNTATFRGTFNSLTELQEYDGHKDINDYVFVIETDSVGNVKYNRYKYAEDKWIFEYTLNNSSFTQTQWAAINSGITDKIIELIRADITNLQNDKLDKTGIDTLRADIANLQNDKVDKTITINNKPLSSNIVLVPTDIGAYSQEAGDDLTRKVNSNTEDIKTASTVATDAKELAQQALDQVVQGTGTQVKVNGTVVSMFDADIKADKSSLDELIQTVNTKADLSYVDQKVADLVGSAPDTLDTLDELAGALKDNADIVTVLENSIANKANTADIAPTIQFAETERLKSKNLFDIRRLTFGEYAAATIDYTTGIITFNQNANSTGSVPIKQFADVQVGKTYTLSFKTTGPKDYIYLNGSKINWYNGTSHVFTQAELDAGVHMYGENDTTTTMSEIQIELGETATSYQLYNGPIVHEKRLSEYLPLSGGAMRGTIVNPVFRHNVTFMDQYTAPSTTQWRVTDWFYDKNDEAIAVRHLAHQPDGSIEQQLDVRRDINNDGTTSYSTFTIGMKANGSKYSRTQDLYIGGTEAYHGYWTSKASGRLTSLNFAHESWSSSNSGQPLVRADVSTGSCKEGKPASDGYVMTWMWDNNGVYDTQFFLPNGSGTRPQIRHNGSGGWSAWKSFAIQEEAATFTSINLLV